MGKAKAVSIIGGADGPTSIFIAGQTGKLSLKERVSRYLYRCRRKRVEGKIKPGAHTLQEVTAYVVEKYHAVEMPEQQMSYIEQRKCLKESLIITNRPELLGDMKEIPKPEVYNEDTIREFRHQIALRSEVIADMPDDVIPMDFHIYEIHVDEGWMEIAIDHLWDILECSYSGNKKVKEMAKDIYLYYGVMQEDVENKSKRYSSLVNMLCT